MDILELKDTIAEQGTKLRNDAVTLLKDSRQFRINLPRSIRRTKLESLESKYDAIYAGFINYDEEVSKFISSETQYLSSLPYSESMNFGTAMANYEFRSALSSHLKSQRETVRSLLQDIGNLLSSYRTQANNLISTWIAIASIVIALISLAVSLIALKN